VPNTTDGNLTVRVGSYTSPPFAFDYELPTVASISPVSGFLGTTLTVTGQFFDLTLANNVVTINGVTATNVSVNGAGTELVVTVPNTNSGNLTVRRTLDNKTSNGVAFTYDLPTITSISPTSGGPGTIITIIGTNFDPDAADNQVRINSVLCSIITASGTTITAYVPSFQNGSVEVRRVPDSKTVTGPTFTYDDVVVSTFAGDISGFVDGVDRLAARFSSIRDLFLDEVNGILYVADQNRLRKIDLSTNVVSTVAGNGSAGFTNTLNPLNSSFRTIEGIAIEPGANGDIFISDLTNHVIRKIDGMTGEVTTYAGDGFGAGTSTGRFADDVNPLAASFNLPRDIALDATGNLFVADQRNNRIRRIDAVTKVVTTFAGSATAGNSDNTDPLLATFASPWALVFDASGNLFVGSGSTIRRIAAGTGVVTTVSNATSSNFSFQIGPNGIIYSAGTQEHRIFLNTPFPAFQTVLAGNGTIGLASGPGQTAQIPFPEAIAVSATGIVYTGATDNSGPTKVVIRKIEN
jgi:hypothetical protein